MDGLQVSSNVEPAASLQLATPNPELEAVFSDRPPVHTDQRVASVAAVRTSEEVQWLQSAQATLDAARTAFPQPAPIQSYDPERRMPVMPEHLFSATVTALQSAKSLLSKHNIVAEYRADLGRIELLPDPNTALGRLAQDLEALGQRLMFSPAMFVNQSTTSLAPNAVNLGGCQFISAQALIQAIALDSASKDPIVSAQGDQHLALSVYQAMAQQYPPEASNRINNFKPGLDIKGYKASIKPICDLLLLRARRLLDVAGVGYDIESPTEQELWIHADDASALGRFASEIKARDGGVLYHPLLLWCLNANANFDVANQLIFPSHLAMASLAPGQSEAHEKIHLNTAHVSHTLGQRHPYNMWITPTDERPLTTSTYAQGFCRDEELASISDLSFAAKGLLQWAQGEAPLKARASWVETLKTWTSDHLSQRSLDVIRGSRANLKKLLGEGQLTRARSTYFDAVASEEDKVSMPPEEPNALNRDSLQLHIPNTPDIFAELTLNGFYGRSGLRVDVLLVDRATGAQLDLPLYEDGISDLVHEALKTQDPDAFSAVLSKLSQILPPVLAQAQADAEEQTAHYAELEVALGEIESAQDQAQLIWGAQRYKGALEGLEKILSAALRQAPA